MIGTLKISTGALRKNAQTLRDLVAPAKAAFVIKSNAYGHGLIETARAIEPLADALCVFAIEEALALREAGVRAPVIVLGPVPIETLDDAVARDIQISLWNADAYLDTAANAARRQKANLRVHVKIDTGIRRLGLEPAIAPKAIERIAQRPGIEIAGIFSHLASAEELDAATTMAQVQALSAVAGAVHYPDGARPDRHIAASAAAMLWPQTRLDLVRFGIALYGLWPSKEVRGAMTQSVALTPALSFETRIVAVRKVEAGAAVGYGGTFRAPRPTRIGVVPHGYADGIPRALSNTGAFIVDGKRCPIAGRVCMNMTMIDLAASTARPGDRAVLIGSDSDASVTADDWADWAGTINYEIVTRLPAALPREYVA